MVSKSAKKASNAKATTGQKRKASAAVREDDDDDEVGEKKSSKKRIKIKAEAIVSSSSTAKLTSSPTKSSNLTGSKTLKKLDKAERLQYAMQSFLWWDAQEPPPGCQWGTMEHNGVSFPDPYVPHGVKMLYEGQPVQLSPVEEEAATFFAAMDPEGMHLGDPKTAKIFIKNFFEDFRAILGKKHIIKVRFSSYRGCCCCCFMGVHCSGFRSCF